MQECKSVFWREGLKCAVPTSLTILALAFLPPLSRRIITPLKFFIPSTIFVPTFYLCGASAERECVRKQHKEGDDLTYEETIGEKVKENLKS